MDAMNGLGLEILKAGDDKTSTVAVCPATLALNLLMLEAGATGTTKAAIQGIATGIDPTPILKLLEELSEQPPQASATATAKALIKSHNVVLTRKATAPVIVPVHPRQKFVAYSTVRVELAKTARGKCHTCRNKIPRTEPKFYVKSYFRCLACTTKKDLTLTGQPDQMLGWNAISQDAKDSYLAAIAPPPAPTAPAAPPIDIEESYKTSVKELAGDALFIDISTGGDAAKDAKEANASIAAATNGTMVDAVASNEFGPIPTGTYLHLANVVHFEAHWKTPFHPANTTMRYFHGEHGDRQESYLNDPRSPALYSISSEATIVSMEYKDDSLRFVAIMPKNFRTWLQALTMGKLQNLIKAADESNAELNVRIPRFSLHSHFNAYVAYKRLGLKTADFTEVAKATAFSLAGVGHKVIIEASEHGSCVASDGPTPRFVARTPMEPVDIIYNTPFLFLVLRGDTICFMGSYI